MISLPQAPECWNYSGTPHALPSKDDKLCSHFPLSQTWALGANVCFKDWRRVSLFPFYS